MSCQSCGSVRSQLFNAEIALHFPGAYKIAAGGSFE